MTFLFLWNAKEDILKNAINQTVSVSIDFNCMDKTNTEPFLKISFLCCTKEIHRSFPIK